MNELNCSEVNKYAFLIVNNAGDDFHLRGMEAESFEEATKYLSLNSNWSIVNDVEVIKAFIEKENKERYEIPQTAWFYELLDLLETQIKTNEKDVVSVREETVKVYKYDELSEGAKENALNWYRGTMDDDFYWEAQEITSMFKYELEQKGYTGVEVNWSLSNSQGDGVAFYGTLVTEEVLQIAERLMSANEYNRIEGISMIEDIEIAINRINHHYNHYNTMEVCINDSHIFSDYPKVWAFLIKLGRLIEEDIISISKELETKGYNEIEYLYSRESVELNIRANEYEFTEDGNRF